VKHFYTNRSGAKCWLDIYHWGADLVVTGRIRDIGQKVLLSSVQTESSSSHSYCHIFLFIVFIRNIIIPRINYEIIICINNNNNSAVINNNLLKSQKSHIALQTCHGQWKHLFEIYRQFGHPPSKRFASTIVEYGEQDITSVKSKTRKLNLTVHTPCFILTFVTVTGDTSRIIRRCGRGDRMETTNKYVIMWRR